MLAAILRRFHVALAGPPPAPDPRIALGLRGGLCVVLDRREPAQEIARAG